MLTQRSELLIQVLFTAAKNAGECLQHKNFVVTHEVGAGGKSFRAGKQSNVHEDGEKPECPCIFVEPMKWMQTGQFSTHDVLPLVF
jgi:hypothetical protein